MAQMRRFAKAGGGVLVTLHDPNLALAYADTVSLMVDGRLQASGAVKDVLTPATLESVYGLGVQVLNTAAGSALLAWSAPAPSP
jgi:iron complex transport system ATP-binding protein